MDILTPVVISDYYQKLKKGEKTLFREKVLNATGLAYPTFFWKMRQQSWNKSELTVITLILQSKDNG